jgi:hypothetical protein
MKEDAQANKTPIGKTGVARTLNRIFALAIVCAPLVLYQYTQLISSIAYSVSSRGLAEEKSILPENILLATVPGTSTRTHSIEEDNKGFLRGNIIVATGRDASVSLKIEANKTSNNPPFLGNTTADDDAPVVSTNIHFAFQYQEPRRTNSSVFIFVLSRRDAFATRQTIRETWASGHDNVYFVMGTGCNVPPELRIDDLSCEENANASEQIKSNNNEEFYTEAAETEALIREEMTMYGDILLDQNLVDSDRSSPAKIKYAYRWGALNLPRALWFVKAGDDMYIRVKPLVTSFPKRGKFRSDYKYFSKIESVDQKIPPYLDPAKDAIILSGHVMVDHKVNRVGKWKETDDYKPDTYPTAPEGDGGHVVSRTLAKYISRNRHRLVNYQGEDVSLGIWADQAPMDVIVLQDKRLGNIWRGTMDKDYRPRNCPQEVYLLGHNFTAAEMRGCHEKDQQADKKTS